MAGEIGTKNGEQKPRKHSETFSQSLMRWLKLFAETFQKNSALSQEQIKAYGMALHDVPVPALEFACKKALREWKFSTIPPPGFIRDCLTDGSALSGPPPTTYPEVSQEERESALEFSDLVRGQLAKDQAEAEKRAAALPTTLSLSEELEQQLEQYREWLKKQGELDERMRAIGLSPIPRCEAERVAIFLAMPVEERRRIVRSGEWKKIAIKNI